MKHIDSNSAKHFIICFVLCCIGLIDGAIIGAICKEWCDKIYQGHWCWYDILFDILGIIFGSIVFICLLLFYFKPF